MLMIANVSYRVIADFTEFDWSLGLTTIMSTSGSCLEERSACGSDVSTVLYDDSCSSKSENDPLLLESKCGVCGRMPLSHDMM